MSGSTGDRDPIAAAFAELAETRPSPDLGPRIKAAVRRSPQPVPLGARWIAGLAAALVIAVAGAWLGLRSTPGPATSSPSPVVSGSATSSSAPGTSDLGPDTIARVTKDFAVGTNLQIHEGQLVFIIAGPIDHDGRPAYLIQHYGDLSTEYQPDGNVVWLSPTMAADVLVRAEPTCPAEASLASVAALQPFERVLCFGGRDLTFEPVTPGDFASGPKTSVRWISSNGKLDFFTGLPVYGLTPPLELVDHGWYRVTGHFDDASSADCGDAGEVAWCRERFVVTAATVVEPSDSVIPGSWTATKLPPIDGRTGFAMAWTGTEAVVWGGTSSSSAPKHSVFDGIHPRDGAAYDPATDTWRTIPNAPIPGRDAPIAVWTGREALVFGGAIGDATRLDGAAWNPATNRWRTIAAAPLGGAAPVGGWLAGRLFIVTSTGVAAYDPSADRWTALPGTPIRESRRSAIVAGGRLTVIGFGEEANNPIEWAVLDPASDRWISGSVPPSAGFSDPVFVGAGDHVAAPNTSVRFDPVSATWERSATCEGAAAGAVWTGSWVLGVTSAWNPLDGDCRDLPLAPNREAPFGETNGRESPVGVWTGGQYITWSGGTGGDVVWVPKDGAVFTPANDLGPCCG